MHGAIIGDIWGSIFETIPKFPRRLFMTTTDDTFLTCACYDFFQKLTLDEKQNPHDNFESIYNKSVDSLKYWGRLFPEPGAFSSSFLNWAKNDGYDYKVSSTNGCIMRQSPIPFYSALNNLSLKQCLELSRIFCYPTHKSDEAFQAVKEHSTLIYLSVLKKINKKDIISIKNEYGFSYEIKPLEYWIELSKNVKNHFIWKSNDSLSIAISALYFSNNWEDLMRFFISISGDVDTYAAIAGPLAVIFFKNFPSLYIIENTIHNKNDYRQSYILDRYNRMKNDFTSFS